MAPDDIHPNRRAELLSVQISMAAVAVFAVVLRLISRFLVSKSPGWDDYIITLGTCLGLTQTILTLSCLPYGAARHMVDIPSRSDLMYILKVAYIACITGPLVMLSVKASLLLLYLRISPCVIFRRCVKSLLVFFTIDAVAWSVLASFQCLPIDHSWKWTKPGHCMNREFLYKAQGLWSLTEDIIIIILPIPTILKLQMHWRRRVLLILVFAFGLVPCGAVIARVIPSAPPEVFTSDFTWCSQANHATAAASALNIARTRRDNPLHIALFPPHTSAQGAYLEFSFLLNASLDVFEIRRRDRNRVDQDLGMLQAVDERLSIWGWETGTGTKFAIVVDMWGKDGRPGTGLGVKGEDVKPAFKALQTAYIRLLQNPFYTPDDHTPMATQSGGGKGGEITSKKFIDEVKRIGNTWRLGLEKV
ncbi:MAG: hypothetical protein LQ338_001105 [Usnochroma carphineum]|nr:MAG: hypothetical protein LQ338_001105 [Usnochroma carphineum]